jgi:hypothetical protein
MSKLDQALAEVKEIEAFELRRYRYNHPIFVHVTAAIRLLEGLVAAQAPPPPPDEVITESEVEENAEAELEPEPQVAEAPPKHLGPRRRY